MSPNFEDAAKKPVQEEAPKAEAAEKVEKKPEAKEAGPEALKASAEASRKKIEDLKANAKLLEGMAGSDPEMMQDLQAIQEEIALEEKKLGNTTAEIAALGGGEQEAVLEREKDNKTPEQALLEANALSKEISVLVKEAGQTDFEKIENAEQKLSQLKNLREKILTAMLNAAETHLAAGNKKLAKKILSQSQFALGKLDIDTAIDKYARRRNGLKDDAGPFEYQIETEYSDKEAGLIMKSLELFAKLSSEDDTDRDSILLAVMSSENKRNVLLWKLSPDGLKVFEDKKNEILKNNLFEKERFGEVASATIGQRIKARANLNESDADTMAQINFEILRSKEKASKRRQKKG